MFVALIKILLTVVFKHSSFCPSVGIKVMSNYILAAHVCSLSKPSNLYLKGKPSLPYYPLSQTHKMICTVSPHRSLIITKRTKCFSHHCQPLPACASLYQPLPAFTILYLCLTMPAFASLHQPFPGFAGLASICQSLQPFASLYHHLPAFTSYYQPLFGFFQP